MVLRWEDIYYNLAKKRVRKIISRDIQGLLSIKASLEAVQKHKITQTSDQPIIQSQSSRPKLDKEVE